MAVALQGLDGGVAVGAGLVDFEGEGFCVAVDCLLAFAVLLAVLVGVLGAVAVEAELEVAVLAGEDSAVSLAIVVLVGLEGVFAAVHAGDALFEQLFHGVSGPMLVRLERLRISEERGLPLPDCCCLASQSREIGFADGRLAEQALDLVGLFLFDL